jgi:hypothetical protein
MTNKQRGCYGCSRGFHDAGGWVWCEDKRSKKLKYYKGGICGGCKYYKKER